MKKSWLKKYIVVLIILAVLSRTLFLIAYIPSESMEPTMETGSLFFCSRIQANKDIKRYDIMVFHAPDGERMLYVKRVIGLPGETIKVQNGHVYADGVELEDGFSIGGNDCSGDGIYEVPENGYFMMGDNRDLSDDSRFWTNKYITKFVAKVCFQIYPFWNIGNRVRLTL